MQVTTSTSMIMTHDDEDVKYTNKKMNNEPFSNLYIGITCHKIYARTSFQQVDCALILSFFS